ncbi:hypothetical protein [Catenulispora pinisilvae]|uniref:hypothetical protein n=1 Tax=Catenulispora pinisilvae TaxID=2705253 RepID=UPI001891BAEF|nr:hypothetical protein [Catenulispora pinisilvae]
MIKRMAAMFATVTVAGGLGAATAHASAAPDGPGAVHAAATTIKTDTIPPGYSKQGSYYWHDSCEAAGQAGIPKSWTAYLCIGDGWPWDSYDLWVKRT